jgi:acyl carrier protein
MDNNVLNELKRLIAVDLDVGLKIEDIGDEASCFEDGLGLDSIAIVDLICLIETHFDFQFADEDINERLFRNLSSLARFIESKRVS